MTEDRYRATIEVEFRSGAMRTAVRKVEDAQRAAEREFEYDDELETTIRSVKQLRTEYTEGDDDE